MKKPHLPPRPLSTVMALLTALAPAAPLPSLPSVGGLAVVALMAAAPEANALPHARRVARRTTRRVVRRHLWALPAGAVPITLGGYRYYRYGGAYYYPYLASGRTIYVEVNGGYPPPPAAEVMYDLGF